MNSEEFIQKVQEFVGHDDWVENSDILSLVPMEHYTTFIHAICEGYKIKPTFISLNSITDMGKLLGIEEWKVLNFIMPFKHLHQKLKGIGDFSDPIADATEIIDESNSYQALMFLREHLEYRITVWLENLKPNHKAFSESWLNKRCPACGHENHMYNSSCHTCGWFP